MADPPADRLPDTEEKGPEFYEKDKGSAQIHGQLFEYKFCALSFLRATNKGYTFKLASNVKGLGAFDDVVVEYIDDNSSKKHIFLQLKSKMKQKITMQQLLAGKGDFSLRKYYDSYVEVEKNFNCTEGVKLEGSIDESLFIIYSNADVGQELKSYNVTDFSEEEFLMTGGTVLKFNEEEHKAIYEHLQELPKHREFLSRLQIFCSQADEKGLDYYIKPELQQSMKLPESELDLTYICFIDFMKDWWQNHNYFLKKTNSEELDPIRKTSEKVRTNFLAKILDQRKSELDDLSIKYKQSTITYMKQVTEPNKAVLIFAPGRSTTLTAAKIHQMLSATKHSILNLQQLIHHKSEVILAWKSTFDVLVLESQRSPETFQGIFNEMSIIMNECGVEKRFIFIANTMGNIQQISALRRTFSTKLREEYDDWKFTDIVTESRRFFLEKKVNFQGSVLQIKNLVNRSDVRMFNALDCDTMSLLLANEKPAIGVPVPNTLKYYIDRALECKQYVKIGYQNESEVLNPIGGGTLKELQCISTYREKNYQMSDYEQDNPHLSLANEKEQETTKMCHETHKLQYLCKQDEEHPLEQNTDVFGRAHRNFQRNVTTVWQPNTLLDGEDLIILVTDEPGMGKSTLLTHLAKETRQRHPDVWIVRVNINNYTSILHDIKANGFEEETAIKLITEAAQIKDTDRAQLEKRLFNYIYTSTGNMAVLIDGVDEVSPHYTEEVIQILRILSQTKIRKIWVTSRNSVKDQLEEEFQCQSYSLRPFSAEDQKSFLVKFWNQKYSNAKKDLMESLATRVVDLSFKHLSDKGKHFLGIPLQSLLLAEVFEENLKQCSTSKTIELPENINLFMLYNLYVKKKWDIYLTDKKNSDRTNVNVLTDDEALYDIFIENHKAAAMMSILSTQQLEKLNDKNLLNKGADFLQKIDQGLEKTGIITDIIEGRPVFLHRTFAEYFVARRLCDNNLDSKTFMRDHLFEIGFSVVRSMVDRILANKCPLHQAVLNSNMQHVAKLLKRKESINEKDRGGRTPLHIAISCRSPELIKLLLEHGADVGSVDTLLGLSPVQYAISMGNWEMMSLLMEKKPEIREQVLNEINNCSTDTIESALRVSAKYGHTDLLRYLINRGNCVNVALPGDSGTLLHEAARGNHIQTVRTLVGLGARCDIQDGSGKTALHVSAEAGSLEVAKFIVERQEMSYGEAEMENIVTLDRVIRKLNRLNLRDNDGNTPLHLAAAAGNTSTVRYLLNAGSDLKSCDTHGEYPLTLAARYSRNDTVKFLLQSCCDVKCEEIMTSALTAAIVAGQVDTTALLLKSGVPVSRGDNEKPIHIASRMGHKEIVRLLMQFGASLTSCNETGNTALHFASEAGHLSLVKYLVELDRNEQYSLNYENETPLHLAARNGRHYLVTYFAKNGCNINAASAGGDTCLHVACENGHYTTVKCLLQYGAEVNAMNSADQTPLHIAASQGQTKIVEQLYLHNANFSLRDKDGITALLAASVNGHQNTVQFIVQHGGNIEDTDGKGNTIAHFAVANENRDILEILSKQKANLEVQNYDGDTPLLKAVREGRKRIVQCLAANLSNMNTKGKDGLRPLDVAILNGNMEITRILLEQGARSGTTGFHIVAAARSGFVDLLQRFVEIGDDLNVKVDKWESPLHAACKSGQVATVQYLCEHGAILDWQDNNGNTALHVAVSNGHLEITRILVEKYANLHVADASGSTALHIAVKGGQLNIVQYLADSFAPIEMRNAKKETALLVATAEGYENIVRVLIEHGAGIGVRDREGKTALDIATEKGYGVIIQLLKDRAEGRILVCSNSQTVPQTESAGGNFENMQKTENAEVSMDKATQKNDIDTARIIKTRAEATLEIPYHRCALNTAAENGNFEQVQRLVKAGEALDYGDTFGRTALWGAASRGHKCITRLLLANGSCVNIPDCEGITPIEISAREGHWEVVDEFLEHGPTIGTDSTEYLWSQLYEASESGQPEVVRIILKCGISVNTTNKYGHTPLHVAAKSGQIEISRILLKSGANVNIADNRGKVPLLLAAEKGHVEIIRNLLSDKAYFDGFNAFSSAALSGQMEVIREVSKNDASVVTHVENVVTSLRAKALKEEEQFVETRLNYGESVDITDEDGSTPLYVAALNGHVEALRELLKHGADVDRANSNGWTPLNIAASKGHMDVIRELLKHGAKLESANKDGWTPLNVAAFNSHVEVVRELLKHGAKLESANKNGWTTLNIAAFEGNLDVVRELLKYGASVHSVNENGYTPLNTAAEKGHVEVVRDLLKQGAKFDSANKNGWTPLNAAASNGHVEVVRELLKHGAKLESANEDGLKPLYTAASNGHVEVVRELLKHGSKFESSNKDGSTPLYTAASNSHMEVVQELLKQGAILESASKDGSTALYTAASNGHLEVVRELLKHGAKLESANKDGSTPLYTAASNGHVEVVRELLKQRAKLESARKDGSTALYTAASNGHLEVVRELLKHGAKLERENDNGWTLLNAAAEKGRIEVVRELLKHGAKLESANKEGSTLLYTAASNGHVEFVRELLKLGAKLESVNNYGWTPLYTTASNGHVEVVRELLKHGAKLESADKYGRTPLYKAACNGHVESVRELLKHGAKLEWGNDNGWTLLNAAAEKGRIEVVRELLKHGAKLESANKEGSTLLYTAASNGHVEFVRELLKLGAKLESVNNYGWTPLYTTASNGHVEVVRELLKHGAKLESADKYGRTPLYKAACNGHVESVRELLKHGTKLESANVYGWTPLYIAASNGHVKVIRELLIHGAKLESKNNSGSTPLYTAALNGHVEVVRELLKLGAELESVNKDGLTPLKTATTNGHMDVVRELQKHGARV